MKVFPVEVNFLRPLSPPQGLSDAFFNVVNDFSLRLIESLVSDDIVTAEDVAAGHAGHFTVRVRFKPFVFNFKGSPEFFAAKLDFDSFSAHKDSFQDMGIDKAGDDCDSSLPPKHCHTTYAPLHKLNGCKNCLCTCLEDYSIEELKAELLEREKGKI